MFKTRLPAALLALVTASTLLTGCVPALVKSRAMEPDTKTPEQFPGEAVQPSSSPEISLGNRNWSDVFTSPTLRKLIDEALTKNQELNIQLQELIIAQAEVTAR